ncbi:hypothetical protein C8R44DRAFT_750264 [Mycena epipterygia]|nr:hypothetical protein C8R44DRAFT_750264 [Mycena epipterygia]
MAISAAAIIAYVTHDHTWGLGHNQLDEHLQALTFNGRLSPCNPKKRHYPRYGARNRREKFSVPQSHIQKVYKGNKSFEYLTVPIDDARAVHCSSGRKPIVHSDGDKPALSLWDLDALRRSHFTWSVCRVLLCELQRNPPTRLFPSAADEEDAEDDAISSDSHITGVEDPEEFANASLCPRGLRTASRVA